MNAMCACGCGQPTSGRRNVKFIHGHNRGGTGKVLYRDTSGRMYFHDRTGAKVYFYRALMEAHLRRPLRNDEVVHHINGDPTDDRIENLQVLTRSEHNRLHLADGSMPGLSEVAKRKRWDATVNRVDLTCDVCGVAFTRPASQAIARFGTFCSASCWRNGRALVVARGGFKRKAAV